MIVCYREEYVFIVATGGVVLNGWALNDIELLGETNRNLLDDLLPIVMTAPEHWGDTKIAFDRFSPLGGRITLVQ